MRLCPKCVHRQHEHITAKSFKDFSDAIEGGKTPGGRCPGSQGLLKCIFNGDNYDEANQKMLTESVWCIDSGVEANKRYC